MQSLTVFYVFVDLRPPKEFRSTPHLCCTGRASVKYQAVFFGGQLELQFGRP